MLFPSVPVFSALHSRNQIARQLTLTALAGVLGAVTAVAAEPGSLDCVAIPVGDGGVLTIGGQAVAIPKAGLRIASCKAARFDLPIVRIRYINADGLPLVESYDSVAADKGVLVTDRISIGRSIIDFMRGQWRRTVPAGQYASAGLISSEKTKVGDVIVIIDPSNYYVDANTPPKKLQLLDATNSITMAKMPGVVDLCMYGTFCTLGPPRPDVRAGAFVATSANVSLQPGKTYFLTSDTAPKVMLTAVPPDYFKKYISFKGYKRPLTGNADENLDRLLTEMSFNLLVDNKTEISKTTNSLQQSFPDLFK